MCFAKQPALHPDKGVVGNYFRGESHRMRFAFLKWFPADNIGQWLEDTDSRVVMKWRLWYLSSLTRVLY